MAVGLRVRDPNTGIIIVEITDRLTRLDNQLYTGASPGAIYVPSFALGTGWACVLEAPPRIENTSLVWRYPRTTISGTTLSWDFPGNAAAEIVPCYVIYGVY